jgi:hypothetical protein
VYRTLFAAWLEAYRASLSLLYSVPVPYGYFGLIISFASSFLVDYLVFFMLI